MVTIMKETVWLLPFFLAGDLLLPFALAPFCKSYSHRMQVMSVLGNPNAPLHWLYSAWLVLLGTVLLAGSVPLYVLIYQTSRGLAAALAGVLDVYAVGACILSGLFPVEESKSLASTSAKIHGVGSAIGFMALLFAPLLVGLYGLRRADARLSILAFACFVLAVLFFVLFVMADKPHFRGSIIACEGLWQRLTLLCMYIPLALLCTLPAR